VFAGKVVNQETGEWPNNRLVLLFLKDQEIGRSVTNMGEFPQSKRGIHDGFFVIQVQNSYQLPSESFHGITLSRAFSMPGGYYYTWFDELEEGSLTTIPVPSKNIKYVLKVLNGDISNFPSALLIPGSTTLKNDNGIVVSLAMTSSAQTSAVIPTENDKIQDVLYATNTETVEINKITVPINNCGGSAEVIQKYIQSQTFIYEYQASAEGGVGLNIPLPFGWANLILELQARYGFEQGQIDSRTIETTLNADAGTNQAYMITWKEIWESGSGTVLTGGDTITIPFRVRTNVIHSIDSQQLSCT
jgi:hypothetical protein